MFPASQRKEEKLTAKTQLHTSKTIKAQGHVEKCSENLGIVQNGQKWFQLEQTRPD